MRELLRLILPKVKGSVGESSRLLVGASCEHIKIDGSGPPVFPTHQEVCIMQSLTKQHLHTYITKASCLPSSAPWTRQRDRWNPKSPFGI